MEAASKHLAFAATQMNAHSSRSHCLVFTCTALRVCVCACVRVCVRVMACCERSQYRRGLLRRCAGVQVCMCACVQVSVYVTGTNPKTGQRTSGLCVLMCAC